MNHRLLETERLLFRRLTEDDADYLFELDNDPAVMRYLNGGIPTLRTVFMNRIFPGFLAVDPEFPLYGFWGLEVKPARTMIGWISYRPTGNDPREVTLGFRLRRSVWGCGYATEAACAIIDQGFTVQGVQCVVATTYEANLASQRVLEKIGMRLVRKFKLSVDDLQKTDTFHVEVADIWDGYDLQYSLTKADWIQAQASTGEEGK